MNMTMKSYFIAKRIFVSSRFVPTLPYTYNEVGYLASRLGRAGFV